MLKALALSTDAAVKSNLLSLLQESVDFLITSDDRFVHALIVSFFFFHSICRDLDAKYRGSPFDHCLCG